MQWIYLVKCLRLIIGIILMLPVIAFCAAQKDVVDATKGAKTWEQNCRHCHNIRPPSEFSSQQWQVIMLHMRLNAGLTGQEERNVLAFLMAQTNPAPQTIISPTLEKNIKTVISPSSTTSMKSNKETKKPEQNKKTMPTGKSGKEVFDGTCIACHGANGKGALPGVPNLAKRLTKSNEVLLAHIKHGYRSHGSSMAMPPRGGNSSLTDEDLKQALEYMKDTFLPENSARLS